MRLLLLSLTIVGVLLQLTVSGAKAHDARPVSVRIVEMEGGLTKVYWRVPGSVRFDNLPLPTLPAFCAEVGNEVVNKAPGSWQGRRVFQCQEELSGSMVSLNYPGYNPSLTTIWRYERDGADIQTGVSGPEKEVWMLPEASTASGVAKEYFFLGVEHLLKGYDHLLFLICLLIISATPKRILITITGFTLAHSLTLAGAALGVIRPPVAIVETLIALSIVFVAAEIVRGRRDSLTFEKPLLIAAVFGLLHGFGFASVLAEAGLPQANLPIALLLFNLGIEVGQILFAVPVMAIILLLQSRHWTSIEEATLQRVIVWPVGALSAFWFVDRAIASFLVS